MSLAANQPRLWDILRPICLNQDWRVIAVYNKTYIKRNTEARFRNHCYSEKAICITYSKCVFVALGIQHALSMRYICHKRHDFREKNFIEHKICILPFSITLSETFLILRINERDMVINYIGAVYTCKILMKLEYSRLIKKNQI
jgi:hypothetical protein